MLASTLILFLSLISLALSLPSPFNRLHLREEGPGSPFECEAKYDAASRKQYLQSVGAKPLDLAITILETCNMSGKAYHFGDTYPPDENGYRKPKTEDAANFGLFKNNWGTIRASCSQFKGQKASDWRNGAVLNINETAAIICQHEQIEALGEGSFYEKQRGVPGQGGSYGNAVGFIKNYLNQGHLKDNLVTYYNLGAV